MTIFSFLRNDNAWKFQMKSNKNEFMDNLKNHRVLWVLGTLTTHKCEMYYIIVLMCV